MAALLFLAVTPALAEVETLAGSEGDLEDGGFGGPVLTLTQIDGQFAVLAGGRGGWIINHAFVIGGGGYSTTYDVEVAEGQHTIDFSYAGLELEYIQDYEKLVHWTVRLLVGGGSAQYNEDSGESDEDLFVTELAAGAELNVSESVRVCLGAGYRYVGGLDLQGLGDGDLSGPTATLTLKFGEF
jgi:hypothetical protein